MLFEKFEPKGIVKNEGKKLNYINFLYVFGIILVVWGHSHPISSDWYGTLYADLNALIYTFHMPLFFFIGGYLMVFSQSVDRLGYKKWALGKICKFMIPYIVLTALAFYPKSLLGDTSDVVDLSFSYFFESTFLRPRVGVWGHFWFIATYIILDLIWGFWRSRAPKSANAYRWGLIIGFIVSLCLAIFPIRSDYFVLFDISQVAIFYVIGILFALMKPLLWDKAWKNLIAIPPCAIIAYFLYPYGNFRIFDRPVINFIVGLCLVWIFWSLAKLFSRFKLPTVFQKLTQYNFSIFLYSWPAQSLTDVILRRMGVNWLIIVPAMFVVGFAVPLIIVFVYKKMKFLNCSFFDYLIGIHK